MHVVAIWVWLAGEHFTHDEAFEATTYGLHFFHAVHLQARGSEGGSYLLSRQVCLDVLSEPFIGNIHVC